jgi:hypothetical protein
MRRLLVVLLAVTLGFYTAHLSQAVGTGAPLAGGTFVHAAADSAETVHDTFARLTSDR